MLNKFSPFFLIGAFWLIFTSAQARWATLEDVPAEVVFRNTDTFVKKDGTYKQTVELQQKILKESGREGAAVFRLVYNTDTTKIRLMEAKTISESGEVWKVPPSRIEDKPLASLGHGFDEHNQLTVHFPNVEIGSQVYIKYTIKTNKVPLADIWSARVAEAAGGYVAAATDSVRSQRPLFVRVNDPRGALEVQQSKEKGLFKVTVTLKEPVCEGTIHEPSHAVLLPQDRTWVAVSTVDQWGPIVQQQSVGYQDVMDQPLPALFEEIARAASAEVEEEAQINEVTSLLASKVHYRGDWRSVAGRFVPRDLAKIAQSQVGDCKDFTASAGAILKSLGYKAQPALVLRGIDVLDFASLALPGLASFNHVILRVTTPRGNLYWIDPTNFVSMAGGIFPDIAGKTALILEPKGPGLVKIPEIDPSHASTSVESTITILDDFTFDARGIVVKKGEEAMDLAGMQLYYSREAIKNSLFTSLADTYLDESQKKSMVFPDLTSRVVRDITITFNYEQKNKLLKTNTGPAIQLPSSWIAGIIVTAPDQVCAVDLNYPSTWSRHIALKGRQIENIQRLACEMDTPWLSVKRTCAELPDGAQVSDTVIFKRRFVTNEEIKSDPFKTLKTFLEQNFEEVVIVMEEDSL